MPLDDMPDMHRHGRSQSSTALLGELIYQHLLQEGHTDTAAAVNRDLLGLAHEV